MKATSIAIINSKAPFGSTAGKEALDVALIFGSYEQSVSLFFHGDGVYQLITNQQPELLGIKNYLKTFSAFEFYDIEKIYVCEKSLSDRQLHTNFHIENVDVLCSREFYEKLSLADTILRF